MKPFSQTARLMLGAALASCIVIATCLSAAAEGMHKSGHARIPTPAGVSIHLVSPQNGASFEKGKPIRVEVRTEGLKAGGDHWHLYTDGDLEAMVGGGRTVYELTGLEPGQHELEVTISNASHKEYDQTDKVNITISDQESSGGMAGAPSKGASGAR